MTAARIAFETSWCSSAPDMDGDFLGRVSTCRYEDRFSARRVRRRTKGRGGSDFIEVARFFRAEIHFVSRRTVRKSSLSTPAVSKAKSLTSKRKNIVVDRVRFVVSIRSY